MTKLKPLALTWERFFKPEKRIFLTFVVLISLTSSLLAQEKKNKVINGNELKNIWHYFSLQSSIKINIRLYLVSLTNNIKKSGLKNLFEKNCLDDF